MAGPGGGPPRRSHTKSRKGCDLCKRRHIRCDENFPQCNNCTKHKSQCPYKDMQPPPDACPDLPNLDWTVEAQAAVTKWQITGRFPIDSLHLDPTPKPDQYTREELRLVYHVACIYDSLAAIEANEFSLWTPYIPTLLSIGATNRFVMDALLSFSALHIASSTNCPLVGKMASEYHGRALRGLNDAMHPFFDQSADAILAASLLISWQASDWQSWNQIMQGTLSIIETMAKRNINSRFAEFIAQCNLLPTAPSSPVSDQSLSDAMEAHQETLQQMMVVEAHLRYLNEDTIQVQELIDIVRGMGRINPNLSLSQKFERLQPLRIKLFWAAVSHMGSYSQSTGSLLVLSHLYTVSLLMDQLFPDIGAAFFGHLAVAPINELSRRLHSLNIDSHANSPYQTPWNLVEFPLAKVKEFEDRMCATSGRCVSPPPQYAMTSLDNGNEGSMMMAMSMPPMSTAPLSMAPMTTTTTTTTTMPPAMALTPVITMPPAMIMAPAPTTQAHMPYGNPAFSYSGEQMPMVNHPEAAQAPVSPLANHQWLRIPCPSQPPIHSPLDAPIAYSDTSNYALYGVQGFPPNTLGLRNAQPQYQGQGDCQPQYADYQPQDSYVNGNSTTPLMPPPEDLLVMAPFFRAPSPYLHPESMGMLPLPESPLPLMSEVPYHHRHTASGSSGWQPPSPLSQDSFMMGHQIVHRAD